MLCALLRRLISLAASPLSHGIEHSQHQRAARSSDAMVAAVAMVPSLSHSRPLRATGGHRCSLWLVLLFLLLFVAFTSAYSILPFFSSSVVGQMGDKCVPRSGLMSDGTIAFPQYSATAQAPHSGLTWVLAANPPFNAVSFTILIWARRAFASAATTQTLVSGEETEGDGDGTITECRADWNERDTPWLRDCRTRHQ